MAMECVYLLLKGKLFSYEPGFLYLDENKGRIVEYRVPEGLVAVAVRVSCSSKARSILMGLYNIYKESVEIAESAGVSREEVENAVTKALKDVISQMQAVGVGDVGPGMG